MANTLLSSTLAARWLLVFCTLSAMLLLLLGHTGKERLYSDCNRSSHDKDRNSN